MTELTGKQAYEARRAEYRTTHPKAEPVAKKAKRKATKFRIPNAVSERSPATLIKASPSNYTTFLKVARVVRAEPMRIFEVTQRALNRHGWYRRQQAKLAQAAV